LSIKRFRNTRARTICKMITCSDHFNLHCFKKKWKIESRTPKPYPHWRWTRLSSHLHLLVFVSPCFSCNIHIPTWAEMKHLRLKLNRYDMYWITVQLRKQNEKVCTSPKNSDTIVLSILFSFVKKISLAYLILRLRMSAWENEFCIWVLGSWISINFIRKTPQSSLLLLQDEIY
jgi:hypothetical protein